MDVVVLGKTTDDLHYKRWNASTGWGHWMSLGGPPGNLIHPPGSATAPSAVSWGPNRTDVFTVGHDGNLWQRFWHAPSGTFFNWRMPTGLGKPLGILDLASGPDVASWGPGRLDVFAEAADGNLWHTWYDGSWHAWHSLGAPSVGIGSDPTAVSWGPGRVDVYVRGGDGKMWQIFYSSAGGWSSWKQYPQASPASDPDVASWAPNRLDVFFHTAHATGLKHWWWEGVSWSHTEGNFGGALHSGPGAVSRTHGHVAVFVQGSTGEIWARWREP